MGAFEISYKGMLIFSKLKAGYWPKTELVGNKCFLTYIDEGKGIDCTQYLAGSFELKEGGYGIPSATCETPWKIESRDKSQSETSPGLKMNNDIVNTNEIS